MKNLIFTFPFKGKVKTQLKISKSKDGKKSFLVKPKDVKAFEAEVRSVLLEQLPLKERPIEGYLSFQMFHYTTYKLDSNSGLLRPTAKGDLDNLFKTLADCFEPLYGKEPVFDKDGNPIQTPKGNPKYKKFIMTEGVIPNDDQIVRASQTWVPVESSQEERIVVIVSTLKEEDLFIDPIESLDDQKNP